MSDRPARPDGRGTDPQLARLRGRVTDLQRAGLRGATQPRLSRRQFVQGLGAGAAAIGLSGLLSACGISGTATAVNQHDATYWTDFWRRQTKHKVLNFANWPLYIDTEHGKHPSLEQFTKATGIRVNYREPIQDNQSFFAQIAPSLHAGESIGYDLIVITNGWQLTQLINAGWLIPLDHRHLPNFERNVGSLFRSPAYDPHNRYTVAWQSGFTGIGYNPKLTGREITSVHDLFDPRFRGHVGMMSDNTELGSVALLALGIDPVRSGPADWERAARLLTRQRPLVRQYYDQSYIKALENGDTWITQAWSGDIFQANASGYPHLKFVVPKEGVMHWTDNLMIPIKAANPLDALMWMNFYYEPKVAAEVADWVNYITPVPAAQPILIRSDPPVGKSPLVFPPKHVVAKTHNYYVYRDFNEYNTWNTTFDPIIQS